MLWETATRKSAIENILSFCVSNEDEMNNILQSFLLNQSMTADIQDENSSKSSLKVQF